MARTASALRAVAHGQIGYVESGGRDGRSGNLTKYGRAYGLDGYAWCSIFVWWCFAQIGVYMRQEVSGQYASAEQAMRGFQARGWKIVKNPRPGDVAFFQFDGDAAADHTGIVDAVGSGGVWTIEGNTSPGVTGSQSNGGGVYRRWRPFSVILGYGRYPFEAEAVRVAKYPTLFRGAGEGGAGDPLNHPVRRLQSLLHVPITGVWNITTERAVRTYQNRHGLLVDGVAGPATLRALGY